MTMMITTGEGRRDRRRRKKNNVNSDTKRIMKILMIVAGVVIALLVLFLVANAAGFFSSGPGLTQEEEDTVEVPELRGRTEEEAKKILNDMELGIKVDPERQPSNQYEEGQIMAQDKEPGTEVDKNTTITVTISSGEEAKTTTVPDVVNREESEAEQMIRDANLTVAHGEAQYDDNVAEGNVISSNPVAGTEIEEGQTVTIVVSLGQKPATVPDIRGMSAADAEAALSAEGLVGSASEDYSDTVEAGKVISQDVDPNSEVDKGTTVSYVVSLGPETKYVTVPPLSNCTEDAARQKLEAAGLTVGTVDTAYSSTVSKGYVISQTASAGSSVEEGTSVGFTRQPRIGAPVAGQRKRGSGRQYGHRNNALMSRKVYSICREKL